LSARCAYIVCYYLKEMDVVVGAAGSTPAGKGKKVAKRTKSPKKAGSGGSHPNYRDMIVKAVGNLKERGGSSRQAILKYIIANYNVGHNIVLINSRIKLSLRKMAKDGTLKQSKGHGAAGSFRIGEKKTARVAKKAKGPKKPRAKKAKKVKKATTTATASATATAGAPAGVTVAAAKPKKKRTSKAKKAKSPKKAKVARKPKSKSPKKAKSPKKKSPKKAKKAAAK